GPPARGDPPRPLFRRGRAGSRGRSRGPERLFPPSRQSRCVRDFQGGRMPNANSRRLLIASLASALALPSPGVAHDSGDGTVPWYGVNKCKGTGDCGGEGTSCAGSNACKRKGFIDMDKDTCLKLEGGRLGAKEDKAEPAKKDEKKK